MDRTRIDTGGWTLAYPDRMQAIIVRNAVARNEGLAPL